MGDILAEERCGGCWLKDAEETIRDLTARQVPDPSVELQVNCTNRCRALLRLLGSACDVRHWLTLTTGSTSVETKFLQLQDCVVSCGDAFARERFTRTTDVVTEAAFTPPSCVSSLAATNFVEGMMVDGALSPEECASLRAVAATALRPLDAEFLPEQLGGSRALLRCDMLTVTLWRRIERVVCQR